MLSTIKAKLSSLVLFLVAFIVIAIVITFLTVDSQKSDGVVINLAGKQRMLLQKMSKEMLTYHIDKGKTGELLKTAELFNKTLNGLIDGDTALKLPPTTVPEISEKLMQIKEEWQVFYMHLKTISSEEKNGIAYNESFNHIIKNNMPLLKKMNGVVEMYEAESSETIRNLKITLIVFILLTIGIGLASTYILKKEVLYPLQRVEYAAARIASGDIDFQMKVKKNDEIGRLRISFNTMITNIKKVQDDLRKEKASVEEKVALAIKESEEHRLYLQRSTNEMLKEMERFASGDLTANLTVSGNDEISALYRGFNNSVMKMHATLMRVMDMIESTSSASAQISSSAEQMAAGAHEQEAQAQEITASVVQMTQVIFESRTANEQVVNKARVAGNSAIEGEKIVSETVNGMQKIAEVVNSAAETVAELGKNSQRIEEIVQTINEIAEQTNLLALNAAIEAARAGEQGRGFAVVADEVRKLADRTTKATGEIGSMIKKIQQDTSLAVTSMQQGTQNVERGRELAERAGSSLKEITQSANEVLFEAQKVTVASAEQSRAAEEIERSISGIATVTRETSIGIQELAKSSEGLNQLTEELMRLASTFTYQTQKLHDAKQIASGKYPRR